MEWVAISYSRASSRLRDWTLSPVSSALAGEFLTTEPPGNPNWLMGIHKYNHFQYVALYILIIAFIWKYSMSLYVSYFKINIYIPFKYLLITSVDKSLTFLLLLLPLLVSLLTLPYLVSFFKMPFFPTFFFF